MPAAKASIDIRDVVVEEVRGRYLSSSPSSDMLRAAS